MTAAREESVVTSLRQMDSRRVLTVLLSVLLCSCSRPMSVEKFVMADGTGEYVFDLDMTDSLHVYDLSFYTRLDGRDAPSGFPMKIYLTSPSGQTYVEGVYFDCSSGVKVPYRTGLVPVERGVWRMSVSAVAQGMCGLGLICEKKDF